MLRNFIMVSLVFTVSTAIADARLEYVDEGSNEVRTKIYIKDGKVRMDDSEGEGYTLYDAKKKEMIFVSHSDRSFTRMDEASMTEVADQVSGAMAELKRELEKMPPEQREMMERMMGGVKDMGKSMFEMKVERSGRTMNKGGHSCAHVIYSVGKIASMEMCVVDEGKLSLSRKDRETMQAMNRQLKEFSEKMSQGMGMDFSFDPAVLGGFPVWMKESGAEHGEVLRADVKGSVDGGMFTIPKDYREEKFAGE